MSDTNAEVSMLVYSGLSNEEKTRIMACENELWTKFQAVSFSPRICESVDGTDSRRIFFIETKERYASLDAGELLSSDVASILALIDYHLPWYRKQSLTDNEILHADVIRVYLPSGESWGVVWGLDVVPPVTPPNSAPRRVNSEEVQFLDNAETRLIQLLEKIKQLKGRLPRSAISMLDSLRGGSSEFAARNA